MADYEGKRVTFVDEGKVEILPFEQDKPGVGHVMVQNVASLNVRVFWLLDIQLPFLECLQQHSH